MPWTPLIALALATAALATVTGIYLYRASRARREISERLHDHALALDRRCDALGEQLRRLDELRSIDHLFVLVAQNEAEGRLASDPARRLRRYALELRAEAAARP